MDKEGERRNRFWWLSEFMPGVVKLMAEKRALYGDAWVNECWRRGMAGEKDWFFARERAVMVGTPAAAEEVLLQHMPGEAYLFVRPKEEATDGTH